MENGGTNSCHALGGREVQLESVPLPFATGSRISHSAPEVDNVGTVHVEAKSSPDLSVVIKVSGKRVGNQAETFSYVTIDLDHGLLRRPSDPQSLTGRIDESTFVPGVRFELQQRE